MTRENNSLVRPITTAYVIVDIFRDELRNNPKDIHAFFLKQFNGALDRYAYNRDAKTLQAAGIYESVVAIIEEEYL